MCASFRRRNDRVIVKDTRASASIKHTELLSHFKSEIGKYNVQLVSAQREFRELKNKRDIIEMSKKDFEITQLRNKLLSLERERDEYLYNVNCSPGKINSFMSPGDPGDTMSRIADFDDDTASIATKIARPTMVPMDVVRPNNDTSALLQLPTIGEFNSFYSALEEITPVKKPLSEKVPPRGEDVPPHEECTESVMEEDEVSIVDEYLQHATPELSKMVERSPKIASSSCEKMLKICPHCQKKIMIYVDYKFICQGCGYTITSYVIENSYYSAKDEGQKGGSGKKEQIINASQIDYKRMVHCNKILMIIQGKNSSANVVNFYTEVMKKIVVKYDTTYDYKKISPMEVRAMLKELNMSDGYKFVSQIHSMITGIPVPQLNVIKQGKFNDMLQKFLYHYVFVKPSKKKNSFIYSYVFRKIFELLNYREFIPYLPDIESKKLTELDITWKKVCERAGWRFIPSL